MKDGGPAFPCGSYGTQDQEQPPIYAGMTLRDYLAGQALVGLLAHDCDKGSSFTESPKALARQCYVVADAMLAEHEKTATDAT